MYYLLGVSIIAIVVIVDLHVGGGFVLVLFCGSWTKAKHVTSQNSCFWLLIFLAVVVFLMSCWHGRHSSKSIVLFKCGGQGTVRQAILCGDRSCCVKIIGLRLLVNPSKSLG